MYVHSYREPSSDSNTILMYQVAEYKGCHGQDFLLCVPLATLEAPNTGRCPLGMGRRFGCVV